MFKDKNKNKNETFESMVSYKFIDFNVVSVYKL